MMKKKNCGLSHDLLQNEGFSVQPFVMMVTSAIAYIEKEAIDLAV